MLHMEGVGVGAKLYLQNCMLYLFQFGVFVGARVGGGVGTSGPGVGQGRKYGARVGRWVGEGVGMCDGAWVGLKEGAGVGVPGLYGWSEGVGVGGGVGG